MSRECQWQKLTTGTAYSFGDDLKKAEIPLAAAGVYTIWHEDGSLLYVGMAGKGKTEEEIAAALDNGRKIGLSRRLKKHASGRRSGDQFCIYVQDRLVLETLDNNTRKDIGDAKASLDNMVGDYVRKHLHYRFVVVPDGDTALDLESYMRKRALSEGESPLLNPAS